MPQAVTQIREAPPVVDLHDPTLGVEIRHIGHVGMGEPPLVCRDLRRISLESPEMLGEGYLLVVVDMLVGEDQHGVAVHRGFDVHDDIGAEWRVQVDVGCLGYEVLVLGLEGKSHGDHCGLIPTCSIKWRHFVVSAARNGQLPILYC